MSDSNRLADIDDDGTEQVEPITAQEFKDAFGSPVLAETAFAAWLAANSDALIAAIAEAIARRHQP
ncbi:hypothetical protein [Kitasatospora sp. NPDC007106]|uniref:hypothetical protein n=1 Tax=Kitasatospora sp. NPDC007106 TaxID=3156914 RepID=UPI0033ED4329